tara:strand:- start:2181 stop:3260 length:1080 start_codon:yes stop_codon:yes gene_type:complete
MAGMIKNIFGLDTQDVLKKRAERNRLLAAQRIKQGDIDPTVAILGQQFGDMLGRGLMKKLGYEDPALTQAKENEALQEQFNNLDKGTAQGNYDAAQLLDKAGRPELAVQFRNTALRMLESSKKNRKEVYSTIPLDPKDILGSKIKQREDLFDKGEYEAVKELDKDIVKLSQLPASLTKRVSTFTDSSFKNREEAFRMEDLAKGFKEQDAVGGIRGKAIDAFKEFAGTEDAVSVLKVQFNKIRADRTLSNLPPGAASDKDVELVMQGFLKPTANAQTITSFLQGLSKLSKIQSEKDKFKSEYISTMKREGGMIDAWNKYSSSDKFKEQMAKDFGIEVGNSTVKKYRKNPKTGKYELIEQD